MPDPCHLQQLVSPVSEESLLNKILCPTCASHWLPGARSHLLLCSPEGNLARALQGIRHAWALKPGLLLLPSEHAQQDIHHHQSRPHCLLQNAAVVCFLNFVDPENESGTLSAVLAAGDR